MKRVPEQRDDLFLGPEADVAEDGDPLRARRRRRPPVARHGQHDGVTARREAAALGEHAVDLAAPPAVEIGVEDREAAVPRHHFSQGSPGFPKWP